MRLRPWKIKSEITKISHYFEFQWKTSLVSVVSLTQTT